MLLFSCSVVSDSLGPHGLQHTRLPCPSPPPGTCSNSWPMKWWCHPTIWSSVISFSFCLQSFPASGTFPVSRLFASGGQSILELQLQHQSFQWIFRIDLLLDWLVWSPCSPQVSRESSPTPQFKNINSLAISFLYGPTLTSIHDYWKNHSFDYMDLCWQSVTSLLLNTLRRFAKAYLPRSRHLLISWLLSPSAVILEPKKIKSVIVSIVYSCVCHEVMGPDAMILVFWMLSFKPAFSFSSFTFIKKLFSCSSHSALRLVSSAYLRLLISLPAVLIPTVLHPAQHFAWCTLHVS